MLKHVLPISVLAFAGSLSAASIPVLIFTDGFEAPQVATINTLDTIKPAGWTYGGGQPHTGLCNCNGSGTVAQQTAGVAAYAGTQVGWVSKASGAGRAGLTYTATESALAKTLYTVTLQARTYSGAPVKTYDVAILIGGTEYASASFTASTSAWQTITVRYQTANTSAPAGLVAVDLHTHNNVDVPVFFDAIYLTRTAVPEPISMALTGLGLTVICAFARARRRKAD